MSQKGNNDDAMLLQTDSRVRFLPELTSEELRAVLKFTDWVSSQATSLQATKEDSIVPFRNEVVRFNADELKNRAFGYMAKCKKLSGTEYVLAMMKYPLHQYHLSQFLYSDITSIYSELDFLDDSGNVFSGISLSYDYTQDIPATDMRTLRDISKSLNVIKEKKAIATSSGNYAEVDDLCDEEEKLLQYVRQAMSESKLDDRARKDYHMVLESIRRVIDKIRKKFKDEEVADYLQEHIKTGIYCYWDE
jgi:hypothetical protein